MVIKMGSICRLCLHKNESDAMKNIFEFSPKYFELNLTEILYWIFDVEVNNKKLIKTQDFNSTYFRLVLRILIQN